MPSSHTALMMALTMMVAFSRGTASMEFAICLALTVIVIKRAEQLGNEPAPVVDRIVDPGATKNNEFDFARVVPHVL